jgi:hypothetical protein
MKFKIDGLEYTTGLENTIKLINDIIKNPECLVGGGNTSCKACYNTSIKYWGYNQECIEIFQFEPDPDCMLARVNVRCEADAAHIPFVLVSLLRHEVYNALISIPHGPWALVPFPFR